MKEILHNFYGTFDCDLIINIYIIYKNEYKATMDFNVVGPTCFSAIIIIKISYWPKFGRLNSKFFFNFDAKYNYDD